MINWFKVKKNGYVTLTDKNITMNTTFLNNFLDAYKVLLGINYQDYKIYIKPVNKNLYERKILDEQTLYNITVRKSYGRISKKEFVDEIAEFLKTSFLSPKKYYCDFDDNEKMLVVDLRKELN